MSIGIGIITYNRLDFLRVCMDSLDKNDYGGADLVVVVDDCSTQEGYKEYLKELTNKGIIVITKEQNKGVAHSKNAALKYMMEQGCEHLFLMEDDIIMKNPKTCSYYISYAKHHTLQHMNFALHGPANIGKGFYITEDEDSDPLLVYPDCVGAFSYYTREVIEVVGYMDENFVNAWEHVWHTLQICKYGYTTPFWYFADHPLNYKLLEEQPGSIDKSSIRPRDDWQDNIKKGYEYAMKTYGHWLPTRNYGGE